MSPSSPSAVSGLRQLRGRSFERPTDRRAEARGVDRGRHDLGAALRRAPGTEEPTVHDPDDEDRRAGLGRRPRRWIGPGHRHDYPSGWQRDSDVEHDHVRARRQLSPLGCAPHDPGYHGQVELRRGRSQFVGAVLPALTGGRAPAAPGLPAAPGRGRLAWPGVPRRAPRGAPDHRGARRRLPGPCPPSRCPPSRCPPSRCPPSRCRHGRRAPGRFGPRSRSGSRPGVRPPRPVLGHHARSLVWSVWGRGGCPRPRQRGKRAVSDRSEGCRVVRRARTTAATHAPRGQPARQRPRVASRSGTSAKVAS